MIKEFDVFISHASEDKEVVAKPLAEKLTEFGLSVWFDEFTLKVGDSLIESIDKGLASSRFGVVILSKSFFHKGYTKYELRGLSSQEISKGKIVLPIWHDINREEIEEISPVIADKFALDTSKQKLDEIVLLLIKVIRPDIFDNIIRYLTWINLRNKAELKYTPINELKPGPIRHKNLKNGILIRIKIVHSILRDVIDTPLPLFIQNFQRDLHPYEEVQVWEKITATYLDLTFDQKLSLEIKQQIFLNLLNISFQSKEWLQKMLDSGDKFIINLIHAYFSIVPEVPSSKDEI